MGYTVRPDYTHNQAHSTRFCGVFWLIFMFSILFSMDFMHLPVHDGSVGVSQLK